MHIVFVFQDKSYRVFSSIFMYNNIFMMHKPCQPHNYQPYWFLVLQVSYQMHSRSSQEYWAQIYPMLTEGACRWLFWCTMCFPTSSSFGTQTTGHGGFNKCTVVHLRNIELKYIPCDVWNIGCPFGWQQTRSFCIYVHNEPWEMQKSQVLPIVQDHEHLVFRASRNRRSTGMLRAPKARAKKNWRYFRLETKEILDKSP